MDGWMERQSDSQSDRQVGRQTEKQSHTTIGIRLPVSSTIITSDNHYWVVLITRIICIPNSPFQLLMLTLFLTNIQNMHKISAWKILSSIVFPFLMISHQLLLFYYFYNAVSLLLLNTRINSLPGCLWWRCNMYQSTEVTPENLIHSKSHTDSRD